MGQHTYHKAQFEEDIRRSIAQHEHSVVHLESEIESLMQDIRKIRFKIMKHQETIRLLKGKITLARRLPPEILATIFEICTFDGWTRAPLVVSHICSEWRQATQIPTVWSRVYVNCDDSNAYGRTCFWLEKSGNVPIDITIEIRAGPVSEIMDLLNFHSKRWRSLNVASLQLVPAQDIFRRCIGPYPILSTLRVSIEEEFGTEEDGTVEAIAGLQSLENSFHSSPQLNTFIIHRNVPPFRRDIPSTITRLYINLNGFSTISLSSMTLMDVLLELPSLEELSISLVRAQGDTTFRTMETPIVVLPVMKMLTLVGKPNLFDVLLQHIRTPSLLRLRLVSSAEPINNWSGSTLLQWLHQGNTSLELFELRDVDVAKDTFVALFSCLRNLKTLKLHDSDISDSIFEYLHGPQGYCPNLAVLDLRWCGQVTGRALVQFVKSRTAMAPIESVTVINCSFVEEQDIVDLACHTICKLVVNLNDHCRTVGCCENERYRKRLRLRRIGDRMSENHRRRIIL
ncbi:hypothetical protein GYMLUDRAFT_38808 [Collybiopsis luxurians FD-317 M1]|nr:hypothetical protein GYMLUDRAFT_38808 [Collybiopsis luxurians FD-317 M1]